MTTFANVLQPLIDLSEAILKFFHDSVGFGWGASIIAMTVVIRVAILPLTFKGVKGMQEVKRLAPEMKRLQERYKEDKQRLQQETMKLYQEHGVNPLSSCLPLLLQLPFFIALYYLLRGEQFARDIAGEESFLFIPDLAGFPPTGILVLMLVAYIGTQLVASAITAVSMSPSQRWLIFALPVLILPVVLIYKFPAGLLLYWITTNVWTIGQQLVVRRLYPDPEPIGSGGDGATAKPARGKPATTAALVDGGGNGAGQAKAGARAGSGDGSPRRTPPPSPRKKKKRSGRRR